MRLFINEFCKIKASKSVKVITVVFLLFAILAGTIWVRPITPAATYGFGAPFMWIFGNGTAGFFLYAAIVAGLFASEFESGVIHNVLGSGVKRTSYFIAKVSAIFSITILIYIGCSCVLFLFRCRIAGFDPTGQAFANYGLKVLVFNGWAILCVLSYVAVYLFIACLLREAVPTFLASLVITVAEIFNLFRGPFQIATGTIEFILTDRILSPEFARSFVPCIYILVISLAAAFMLFLIQDID